MYLDLESVYLVRVNAVSREREREKGERQTVHGWIRSHGWYARSHGER